MQVPISERGLPSFAEEIAEGSLRIGMQDGKQVLEARMDEGLYVPVDLKRRRAETETKMIVFPESTIQDAKAALRRTTIEPISTQVFPASEMHSNQSNIL
jgi:hypothetical protein